MKNYYNLLLQNGRTINYKNNEVVFNEDDLCENIGFIIKGKIKIYTSSKDDNEIIINTLSENDCFGDLLLFSSKPYYYGTAIALVNTTICYLTKQQLINIMQNNTNFLQDFLKNITNKGVELKQKNKLFAHKNIEERITYYLYNYQSKYCDSCIYIKSITDLANFLSIPRPSLSRTLHKMEKENKIKIEKNKIRLIK